MPDKDWIAILTPDEAEAALKSIMQSLEGPLSAREATGLHRMEQRLKAKAASTQEPVP